MWIAISNAIGQRVGTGGGSDLPYTPPLDGATDILAAYSVRKLLSTYSGPCMEVHRISDGAKQDIYFDSDGLVNTADIIAFASGSDLQVSTWYDQGPLSNHAIINPAQSQPLIYDVSAGGLYSSNGFPEILGNKNSSWALTSDITTANSIFDVRRTGGSVSISNDFLYGNSIFYDYHSGSDNINNIYLHPSYSAAYVRGGNNYELGVLRDFTTYAYSDRHVILSMLHTSASGRINQLSRDRTQTGRSWSGSWQESIIFGADKTSSRTTLESNINSYYQITNLPDYTSGFLSDYPGAAAAYSVRALSNTAIKCMRVRRTVSPFDEQDIGFDSNGDLDTAAIATFGGSDPLTVSAWYDQSGQSNHATQVTAGSQPSIYDGTATITDNGKSALDFDGADDFFGGIAVGSATANTLTWVGNPDSVTAEQRIFSRPISATTQLRLQNTRRFHLIDYELSPTTFTVAETSPISAIQAILFAYITNTNKTPRIGYNGGTFDIGTTLTNDLQIIGTAETDAKLGSKRDGAGNYLNGKMQEFILWTNDQSSNRTAIESDINTYFSIY